MKAQRSADLTRAPSIIPGIRLRRERVPRMQRAGVRPRHCSSDIRAFINSICFKRSTDMLSARCINV